MAQLLHAVPQKKSRGDYWLVAIPCCLISRWYTTTGYRLGTKLKGGSPS